MTKMMCCHSTCVVVLFPLGNQTAVRALGNAADSLVHKQHQV